MIVKVVSRKKRRYFRMEGAVHSAADVLLRGLGLAALGRLAHGRGDCPRELLRRAAGTPCIVRQFIITLHVQTANTNIMYLLEWR